jgi:arylsulfatase A-like enzyme
VTPHLDRLASEGIRLESFYTDPTCTPSRTMLMTGTYAQRFAMPTAYFPWDRRGLHPDEVTIAEVLRDAGYATAIVGKWHLGHHPELLPTRQGFDEYFGIPYSNDMGRVNPLDLDIYPDLPLFDGERVIELEPDQAELTRRYTERAVDFIRRHRDEPFFLYLAHSMPHWPIQASAAFLGRSGRGLYGDVIAELDGSVGEVMGALAESGLDERTLVIFASDNGPWLLFGDQAGSSGGLREGKGTTFEGGVRVPAIARWPGRIPAGASSSEPIGLIDLLPTVARLAGAPLPSDRVIDGRDVWPILSGEPAAAPREAHYFFNQGALEAVRSGRWKLHLPHSYAAVPEPGVMETREIGMALFDLEQDPGEMRDRAASNPEVVERLLELAEQARADLGDRLTGRAGSGLRPQGDLDQLRPPDPPSP